MFAIKRIGSSNCNVSIVEGGTHPLNSGGEAITVQSNGTFWYIISHNN
jgi:hypothetical protein